MPRRLPLAPVLLGAAALAPYGVVFTARSYRLRTRPSGEVPVGPE
ncbi:hypothetical protein ACFXD5_02910 [Streptomyces sp. NPDC059385]